MNTQLTYSLLMTFAVILFGTSIALFVMGGSTVIGAANVAIGSSLLAIAASQKKKNDGNG